MDPLLPKRAVCSDWSTGSVCCDWSTASSVFQKHYTPYHNPWKKTIEKRKTASLGHGDNTLLAQPGPVENSRLQSRRFREFRTDIELIYNFADLFPAQTATLHTKESRTCKKKAS